jgi:preprotein translocase subunit SecE
MLVGAVAVDGTRAPREFAMQIYKKGQGNKARAVAALAAVAIAAFGVAEAHNVWGVSAGFIIASAIMIAGVAGVGIYLALINARTSEFLIETQAELKKVAWPPKAEVKGSAMVVVGTVIVLGLFLFAVDNLLAIFTNVIRVYPTAS